MAGRNSRPSSSSAETIVALSTPLGDGLRAVVRLSGPRAVEIGGAFPGAVAWRAPRTYTREDLVEIHLPGSPPLVDRLLRSLVALGARPARSGEFTLRAFLNGRIDLAQAEAVEQLISAEGGEERRAALAQLEGTFSRRLRVIEGDLLDLCADVEASIDFVDEEIEILSATVAVERSRGVLTSLCALLAETTARTLSDARPTAVLYGRPNAGKSSLFNALAAGDALVTDIAGTTRDVLAAEIDLGVRIRLLDTAGQRENSGLEIEAARRGREAMESADILLFVVDGTDGEGSLPLEPRDRPAILILNKCDLGLTEGLRNRFHIRESVCTSARTGEGLADLRRILAEMAGQGAGGGSQGRFRVNVRQRALLREAEAALERAVGTASGLGMEFVALDLRAALDALGSLSGRQVGEDLLDRIFSRFCLGK
jgi:tRNA modification GTPase